MRIQLLSDLHIEFEPENWLRTMESYRTDADVLVLAGDIAQMSRGLPEVLKWSSDNYARVFFVAGNHEYYGASISYTNGKIEELTANTSNLSFLRAGTIEDYGGKQFVGDTMWFDYAPENAVLERYLNDFGMIVGGGDAIYEQAALYEAKFPATVSPRSIVITHHLPHGNSVVDNYKSDPLTRFFLRDQSKLIERAKPALWMHGHTHFAVDYVVGETRVVCNPRGYPHDENSLFNPRLIIEI